MSELNYASRMRSWAQPNYPVAVQPDTASLSVTRLGRPDPTRTQIVFLARLPNHRLLHPIPIHVRSLDRRGFIARFSAANLAMCGDTISAAVESLADDISDTFAVYSVEESNLGPEPEKQFRVLRHYIAE